LEINEESNLTPIFREKRPKEDEHVRRVPEARKRKKSSIREIADIGGAAE